MSETPGVSGDDPDAYEDESVVPCPACDSKNVIQIGPRGPAYQCQDCTTEFKLNRQPTDADPETLP